MCPQPDNSPRCSFNSQPPEGGWHVAIKLLKQSLTCFNSQPPEGGWARADAGRRGIGVSTHSRPKAAGASAETLNRQGLHCPVSLRFH